MKQLPSKLQKKLNDRLSNHAIRKLEPQPTRVDFSSNDYLGLSRSKTIFEGALDILKEYHLEVNGATGSRLLSGNHDLYTATEEAVANFHDVSDALIFNSGYDANLGFFSSVPQRSDLILYDELCHASIRDGIRLSNAKAYKFEHNSLANLKEIMERLEVSSEVYVVTEAVFSMDGDTPDLMALADYCREGGYRLVVDEAHAVGVLGQNGRGLVQELGIQDAVFARVVTFGKAMGCHGAAVLGSSDLKSYLVNFARSFIYTTGLPPHSLATIKAAYSYISEENKMLENINSNIGILQSYIIKHRLSAKFIKSNSAIHCCLVPGNSQVRKISQGLMACGFDVRPIMSPTVPLGEERLRICLHSFNTEEEIGSLMELMATFVE